jgi:xanthine dehydrogenase large subunit
LEIARQAVLLVNIDYELLPALTYISDAIKVKSFMTPPLVAKKGEDVQAAIDASECTLEGEPAQKMPMPKFTGEISVGGQEHMYMETHTALVVPGEHDEMHVYSSTQGPGYVQIAVCALMAIPMNKVIVECKRIGRISYE